MLQDHNDTWHLSRKWPLEICKEQNDSIDATLRKILNADNKYLRILDRSVQTPTIKVEAQQ